MKSVSVEEFDRELLKMLGKYGDEVTRIIEKEAEEVGKDTAAELQKTSPRRKKSRGYYKGWRIKVQNFKYGVKVTVHNKTFPQLTHLLEKGHQTANGGRTKAYPHIAPAESHAMAEILQRLRQKLGG